MFYRPWPIVILAIFHIISPLYNLFSSAELLKMNLPDYITLQLRHGPVELILWVLLPIVAGIALLTFRMWSYYLFLFSMTMVTLFTLRQRLLYPHRIDIFYFLFLQLINLSIIAYFLSPVIRRIYHERRVRWWQQKPRFLVTIDGSVERSDRLYPCTIDNISEGGAHIKSETQLSARDEINLVFKYSQDDYLIHGQVVHSSPLGYGVLFKDSLKNQRRIVQLVKQLRKENTPVRGPKLTMGESFKSWAHDLLKTGHGIFPDL